MSKPENTECTSQSAANPHPGLPVCKIEVNVPNSRAAFEMVGQVSEKDGIVSTSLLWEGGDGRNCQRGVSVRNNVIIDVSDCGYNVSDSVVPALIKPIAAKIDAAR